MGLLRYLLIGFAAGWMVGRAMRGRSFGWFGSTFFGVLGSLAGGYLFGFFGLTANSTAESLIRAMVGAIALLLIASFLRPSSVKRASAGDDE